MIRLVTLKGRGRSQKLEQRGAYLEGRRTAPLATTGRSWAPTDDERGPCRPEIGQMVISQESERYLPGPERNAVEGLSSSRASSKTAEGASESADASGPA